MALSASVLGASGFSGGEVVRLLLGHPAIELTVAAAGDRSAGATLAAVHPHLHGEVDLPLANVAAAATEPTDVCFACLPPGAFAAIAAGISARVVIDLSSDHRAADGWIYGLTEHTRARLIDARAVANPGCYPTATLLGLVPFARLGLIAGPIIVDALSGASGAGRGPEDRLSLSVLHGNAAAYGPTPHRHVVEMERALARLTGLATAISFTPHLVPMARGVLVTARAPLARSIDDASAHAVLAQDYDEEPFVHVVEGWPATKSVAGTNRAHVSARVDDRAGFLIVSVAIDNLGKGAAGQAVQNANLALGLDETTGLGGTAVWP